MNLNNLIFIALTYPAIAFSGWLGPGNYDECVLESMKGVTSDMAATAIVYSCRNKFPEVSKSNESKDCMVQWNGNSFRKIDVAP